MRRSRLERFEALLDAGISVAAVAVTLVMVVLVFVAVLLRYGFDAPLVFSYDVSTMLFAWMIFLGLFVAERDGAHLGVDAVQSIPSERARMLLLVLRQAVLIAVAAYMTWIGFRLVMRTGMLIPSLRISGKWLYAAMPVGFGCLTLIYLLRLPRVLRSGRPI